MHSLHVHQFSKLSTFLLLLLSLIACGRQDNPTTETPESNAISSLAFERYFPEEVVQRTLAIKEQFDAGLRNYAGAPRELPYLYGQNLRQLRSHFIQEESFRFVFPFNGELSWEEVSASARELPFMSRNCGFQRENGETLHFYCPALDSSFFNYLEAIEPPSPMIQQFHDVYLREKAITPDLRYQMLMSGLEELDFDSPDHQLFYAFFQLWVYAEMRAKVKFNG